MNQIHQNILTNINPNYQIISRFSGGMSNYTYLIKDTTSNIKMTFRYPGEGAHNFVDYYIEEKNISLIDKLNINSNTLYLEPESGIKISTYISGSDLKEKNTSISNISDKLKQLHRSDIVLTNNYNHLDRLTTYESICSTQKDPLYLDLKNKFIEIFNTKLSMHINKPCHCDAQLSNFVLSDDNELYLLDWEFAAMNDYIYDIASYGNVDIKDALELLNEYEDIITSDLLVRLYGWRMFQCLQWHNVATYKAEIGLSEKLNIPFDIAATNYLNLAETMYEQVLENL